MILSLLKITLGVLVGLFLSALFGAALFVWSLLDCLRGRRDD